MIHAFVTFRALDVKTAAKGGGEEEIPPAAVARGDFSVTRCCEHDCSQGNVAAAIGRSAYSLRGAIVQVPENWTPLSM